ncbi:patatin-like phospholipase family protein [bacterium]|nr:patatin-like phospholipase family protein [bacterium]
MRTALLLVTVALAVPGCARHHCVPPELAKQQLTELGCGTDLHAPVGATRLREMEAEFRQKTAAAAPAARPYQFLVLSGGGMYGAFGIGVLDGWTDTGARPEFDAVTGISTGALMATFAFLGPRYDAQLYEAMVGIHRNELIGLRPIPFLGDALFHNRPIRHRLERYITPQVIAEVAAAHAAGRRLYVGTTNLDTRRLVIWDMGEIASRGTPESVELYRTILLASASVPVAFPPVRIPVEVDGRHYEELHVDGGACDEVVFRPFMVADLNRANGIPGCVAPAGSVLYIVSNGKLYAEAACVRPRILSLLNASFRSVIYGKSRDELYRIYLNCLETGVMFRATAVPQDLYLGGSGGGLDLDDETQTRLFQAGLELGRRPGVGVDWLDLPPGAELHEQEMPRSGTRFMTTPR